MYGRGEDATGQGEIEVIIRTRNSGKFRGSSRTGAKKWQRSFLGETLGTHDMTLFTLRQKRKHERANAHIQCETLLWQRLARIRSALSFLFIVLVSTVIVARKNNK